MGDVVAFTGEIYTRARKADDICEELTCDLVSSMSTKYGFKIDDPNFLTNIAWLIKFMKVVVDDELGLANELSRELKVVNDDKR